MSEVQASGDSNEEGRTTRVLSADNADNVQNQIHQTTPTVGGVGRRDQFMSPSYISPVSSATPPTAIVDNYEEHRQHHSPQHASATPQASSETRRSREVRNTIDSNVRKSSNGSNDAITTPVAQSFLVQQSYDSDASDGR